MDPRPSAPKKVRLACRRCRTRRIKCDGQTPACTNCAKAGQICVDVDSQNSDVLIPRNFASAARARIQWLEGIIKERAPDVDLGAAPQIDLPLEIVPAADRDQEDDDLATSSVVISRDTATHANTAAQQSPQTSRKRPAEPSTATDHDSAFPERAHSVAMSLGMLSLNSDSPQKHYLGSSSGLLFANLIGASPPCSESTARQQGNQNSTDAVQTIWQDGGFDTERGHVRQYHQSLINLLRQELPRKDEAVVLVHNYLRWIHPDYPILEPESLLSALTALYSCLTGDSGDKVSSTAWPRATPAFRWNGQTIVPDETNDETVSLPAIAFILLMVFNISAIVKVRSRVYDYSPDRFYRAAMQASQGAFSHVTLPSIQALVMLIVHSMLTPAEVKLWTLVHIALAHCVEVGLHREQHEEESRNLALQQIRRFTFFTIYSLDRSISSIQGRPLGFRDETFDIKMPELLPLTEQDDQQFLPSFSTAVTRYSIHRFKMDRLVSDIKLHLYHLPIDSAWLPRPANPEQHQTRIAGELAQWREAASDDSFDLLGLDQRQSQIWKVKLKILYNTAMVLLFQPSQVIRSPSPSALQNCFDNASCILHNYQLLHDMHGLQHGWRSVQNVFAAGATLIYSFWTSETVRERASTTDISKSLRTCSNLLTIGGEWWPSAKSGQSSLGAVADLTLRKLYKSQLPSKHPRLLHATVPAGELEPDPRSLSEDGDAMTLQFHQSGGQTQQIDDAALGGHGSDWQQVEGAAMPAVAVDPWETTFNTTDTGPFAPEIENFLADFDRSEFSWSFPLDQTEHPFDLEAFRHSGF